MLENSQIVFISEIKSKVRNAQYEAMKAVNVALITLYWEIGKSISENQVENWGKSIVPTLSKELQNEFPGVSGFSTTNLWLMTQFYTEYQLVENLHPLVGEISWSKHVVILSKCKDPKEREFYILSTKKFGWTKNVLIHQIENQTFQKYLVNQTNFDETLPEKIRNQAILAIKDEAIGIIICKSKDRTIVEYSLKSSNLPIGVATYSTSEKLPKNYQKLLPNTKELSEKFDNYIKNLKE